ncbi:UvrD-helicase domain-containing protein [Prochlorococcus sp. MIT 1300]|uniref:UvrD-helicase domain-containing protein n=1 Tax=Prochlorococcus sp. MIT 1300 TaxID=3096218 RepID=UPI002A761850|nr:UvrD-helicase domain-containing protein [Prochlorococcus sp. MIT 1300]
MDKTFNNPVNLFKPNEYPLTPGVRLIEASAGTGKTFALAHLILRLITEGQHAIDQILVVTFTDAAAEELRSRVSCRIEEAIEAIRKLKNEKQISIADEVLSCWLKKHQIINPGNNKWEELLIKAQEGLDRADITTIHGFCRRALRREAIEAGTAIEPRLEGEDKQLVTEVVHEYWKEQVLSLEAEDVKGLIQAGLNIENLIKQLIRIDSDPSITLDSESKNLDKDQTLHKQFKDYLKDKWIKFKSLWLEEGYQLDLDLRHFAEGLRSIGVKDTKPFSPNPTKDRYGAIQDWIDLNTPNIEINKDVSIPLYGRIRDQDILSNYYHPSIFWKSWRKFYSNTPKLPKQELQVAIANLLDGPAELVWNHALLWGIIELKNRRNESGTLSYSDLLSSLDPKKGENEENEVLNNWQMPLVKQIRNYYEVVLVDEFQDTDPVQWRILKHTFGTSQKHLLLMVGDPKQAIYGFRGGDLDTYLEARDFVEQVDELRNNYRTTNELMIGLNQFMEAGLIRSGLPVPSLKSSSKRKAYSLDKNKHPLQVIISNPMDKSKDDVNLVEESKTTVEQRIPLVVAHLVLKLLRTNNQLIQPKDICILVSRHDQAASIQNGLDISGIPTQLISRGDVLTSEASQLLQRLLDCLARPGDSFSLRLLACSSLLQWSPTKLIEAEINGELDQLALKCRYWSKNLSSIGLFGCLGELLEGEQMADLSQRGRLLSDLHQCAQLTQTEIHTQDLDAESASQWLRFQRLQALEVIPESRRPHSDVVESAVSVLTIHRSKGLEYPIVICPYLWQAPPTPEGPLWKHKKNNSWQIALNTHWGMGEQVAQDAKASSLQEAERLAYVALTRASDQVLVLWAKANKQETNPLMNFLFGGKVIKEPFENISLKMMEEHLRGLNISVSIDSSHIDKDEKPWEQANPIGELNIGPVPDKLDTSWGRSSYSSWISSKGNENTIKDINPREAEEGRDIDQQNQLNDSNNELPLKSLPIKEDFTNINWSKQGPLDEFPRGSSAGECLHKILEQINFTISINKQDANQIIEKELRNTGIDLCHVKAIKETLDRLLSLPIGGALQNLKFNELNERRRIHELKFDLPIRQKGKSINSEDIANAFKLNSSSRFGNSYIDEIKKLNINSKGFLVGAIDLVFCDEEDVQNGRWWVVDWKSNWIGESSTEEKDANCGPFFYDNESMERQMIYHHYPLQAHLYLVALHRFLKWRLPSYIPKKHLGGYVYVFLRGLPKRSEIDENNLKNKLPGLIVEPCPTERILRIDEVINGHDK